VEEEIAKVEKKSSAAGAKKTTGFGKTTDFTWVYQSSKGGKRTSPGARI